MKVLILTTKDSSGCFEKLNNVITNAFEDLGKVFDEPGYKLPAVDLLKKIKIEEGPKSQDTGLGITTSNGYSIHGNIKKEVYVYEMDFDIVIFEMPWYGDWQKYIKEFAKLKSKKTFLVGILSAPSRFFDNIDASILASYKEAFSSCDVVGVLNKDQISFMELFSDVKTYHIPVPIDTSFYTKDDTSAFSKTVSLCCHSDFFIPAHAKRGDISTFLTWKLINKYYKNVFNAVSWVNRNEFVLEDKSKMAEVTNNLLSNIGIDDVNVKFAGPEYKKLTPSSFCIIQLSKLYAQSRISMYGAAIGVPVISTDINETHTFLWPELCVPWHRPDLAFEKFQMLLNDIDFYFEVTGYAQEKLKYYSPESCKKRFKDIIQ